MNSHIDIDSWLLRWWALSTFHSAVLCCSASAEAFSSAFLLWVYLGLLNLGRFAFNEAREALERRRRPGPALAPFSAGLADDDDALPGAERT